MSFILLIKGYTKKSAISSNNNFQVLLCKMAMCHAPAERKLAKAIEWVRRICH